MERLYYVYILASQRNGTLYTGVTGNLAKRVYEHREDLRAGFTRRYGVKHLVWYAIHNEVTEAIAHEKKLKRWRRAWKLDLIEKLNPQWRDLYETLNS
ncbi:MAG: GIY-YIG nuclease family protein [Caulobacteraceae bacterium]|nr:GIY-YIG nuclease family protein [Caulobacteraceae bacterium]